ncbi:hypothetical protein [Streptomyces sp. NPDC059455]|uniref:hypothetical protein n=1 Tax=Streptomyces sp. NPDC059455 TaxID=3346837 RepID=UPI0036C253B7
MPLIGNDWAEDHHDLEIQDDTGRKLAGAKPPGGVEGIAKLHKLVAKPGGTTATRKRSRSRPRCASGSFEAHHDVESSSGPRRRSAGGHGVVRPFCGPPGGNVHRMGQAAL